MIVIKIIIKTEASNQTPAIDVIPQNIFSNIAEGSLKVMTVVKIILENYVKLGKLSNTKNFGP